MERHRDSPPHLGVLRNCRRLRKDRLLDGGRSNRGVRAKADAACAFYSATPELRDPDITWHEFKTHFLKRFRDVRSDQYHFSQLQMARQRKDETATKFLDRCRLLARWTVPCTTDPMIQRVYEQAERMLLSAFILGLSGTPADRCVLRCPPSPMRLCASPWRCPRLRSRRCEITHSTWTRSTKHIASRQNTGTGGKVYEG